MLNKKVIDTVKPVDGEIARFNTWLNWKHTELLFKHPRAKKISVNGGAN